jgi:hypothetical protein
MELVLIWKRLIKTVFRFIGVVVNDYYCVVSGRSFSVRKILPVFFGSVVSIPYP